MPLVEVPNNRVRFEGRVIARARRDPSYAELLRRDPRAALELEAGVSLPADLHVLVVEETPQLMCLVIPTHLGGMDSQAASSLRGGPRRRKARNKKDFGEIGG
jgi:hypothetical protein